MLHARAEGQRRHVDVERKHVLLLCAIAWATPEAAAGVLRGGLEEGMGKLGNAESSGEKERALTVAEYLAGAE